MPTLYEDRRSGNCYKVRLLLHHLGEEFTSIPVDVCQPLDERPADLLEHQPNGRAPVFVLDDGRGIAESNAILTYLAGGTPYLADDPVDRARTLAWLFFEQNLHEPNIASSYASRAVRKNTDAMAALLPIWHDRGIAALATMEQHLGGANPRGAWFGPDAYSIADIALFAYTQLAPLGGFDLEPYPAVRAWLDRVREQPGWVPMDAPAAEV